MCKTVSVVIPVKNGAKTIRACIEGILAQSVPVKEIIVIDSGSTDGTIDIINGYDEVNLIEIPPNDFNHGLTRNLGVQKATGKFVILTVQDARPYNEYWIEELLKGFTDNEVAGVCGQQFTPHEKDKNPVEWFRPISGPQFMRYQFKTKEEFIQLTPTEKKYICRWDDVTAMYKRIVLLEVPFQKTSFCEDTIWARDAIIKGYAIVYNDNAKVYHYHIQDADFVYKRNFTIMYVLYRNLGYLQKRPDLTLHIRLSILKTLVKSLGFDPIKILKWNRYNITNINAMIHSYEFFMECLSYGDNFLAKQHELLCGKPPSSIKT